MTAHVSAEQEVAIFKKGQRKRDEQWFVRVTCNFFEPRIYGPFPTQQEAVRFREGAEFELRKLLDFQLPVLSGNYSLGPPRKG